VPAAERHDVVKISRRLSALVNVQDDNGLLVIFEFLSGSGFSMVDQPNLASVTAGVLVGNWSGDYAGGQSPSSWTGSATILQQWYNNGKPRPVKYGQCWVFSAVLTTVCRCLGIPARTVTNFASAHDTHNNRMIDKYFDEDGKPMEHANSDSIWNFHVWNDLWFARKDLPDGRGGWQACDATPQERSQGIFQCGPASLVSIKAGEKVDYDLDFLIGEVNADVIYHQVSQDGSSKIVRRITNHVGKTISTKAVGSYTRLDLTSLYKYPEGTAAERAALLGEAEGEANKIEEDVFDLQTAGVLEVGKDVGFVLDVKGKAGIEYEVRLVISATSYNGGNRRLVKELSQKVVSPATVPLTASIGEYHDFLHDCDFPFEFSAFACADGGKVWVDSKQVSLTPLELVVKAPTKLRSGERGTVTVSFTNPLDVALHNCTLKLVAGFNGGVVEEQKVGELEPEKSVTQTFSIQADGSSNQVPHGARQIIVELESEELTDIVGSAVVNIA